MERFEEYLKQQPKAEPHLLMGCIAAWKYTGRPCFRDYVVNQAREAMEEGRLEGFGMALLFALEETGEEDFRRAVEQLAETPMEVARLADAYAVLPFRMAYEMKLNRMAWVSRVVEQFSSLHQRLYHEETGLCSAAEGTGFSPSSTGWYLAALVDTIEACDQQLYEHWRSLVNIFRQTLRGMLLSGSTGGAEAWLVYSIRKAVRLGLIDPERYLPKAETLAAMMDQQSCPGAYWLARTEER